MALACCVLLLDSGVRQRERREQEGQPQTATDSHRQRQTETDRDRQRQTEIDRDRQTRANDVDVCLHALRVRRVAGSAGTFLSCR